jgi:hypothetical protein
MKNLDLYFSKALKKCRLNAGIEASYLIKNLKFMPSELYALETGKVKINKINVKRILLFLKFMNIPIEQYLKVLNYEISSSKKSTRTIVPCSLS